MMASRYARAKQFRRHQRQLRILSSRPGPIIRDIRRNIEGQPALEEAFALSLGWAAQIRSQQQRQRGWKLYSFHGPEVECIGKAKAAVPYEFGVKASVVTNNRRAPGGEFVLHASAMPDNPYDGHPLRDVIERTETLTGCPIERAYVDKGYRGHDAQNPRRVFISGQKRSIFGVIKRELRRRSVIEPIIGHMKAEGHPRPLLPQRPRRRRRQCRPLSRRPQLPAASSPGSENSSSCRWRTLASPTELNPAP
ncbi:transposase, IS5 family [Bradyrhizobium arachidis]|nr:transposase, IS5 family [Bradyrhizobium arachidis]